MGAIPPNPAGRARRIVFVNRFFTPDISATSQILADLTSGLVWRGVEVHVICSRQLYDDPNARLPAHERLGDVAVHRVWTARFGRSRLLGRAIDYLTFYASALLAMLRLLRPGDVVVAKTDPPLISLVGAVVARIRGAQLINWLQDVFPEVAVRIDALPWPRVVEPILRALRNHSLRTARLNIVLGERMRQFLLRQAVPAERVRVIENWFHPGLDAPIACSASQLRASLGLEGSFVVGYSGNLGRAHEYRTILGAAHLLRGPAQPRFLMVGGGACMIELRREAELGKLENITFLPYQPRAAAPDCLAAADVHLCCLLPVMEGLIVPSKFYGVLAAGRPVIFIGDPDGEIAGIVARHQIGHVVRTGDSARLAGLLNALQAQPALCASMGARSRMLFESSYTLRRALDQWRSVLSTVGIEPGVRVLPAAQHVGAATGT